MAQAVPNPDLDFRMAARHRANHSVIAESKLRGDTQIHIINVSALEGKFAVGKKSTRHPQTNMSKAALNMMTFTCARDYFQKSVLVNAVDTGLVTDNAPGGLGAKAQMHETHVAPPLDEDDGASRVLDPIFRHLNSGGEFRQHGFFWKDYEVSSW